MMLRTFFNFATVKSFGVIGAGQMGTGIAIVANKVAKLPVVLYDSNPISLRKSQDFVESWLKKEEGKGRLTTEDKVSFNQRMHFSEDINKLKEKDIDFVVEVVIITLRLLLRI